MIQTLEWTPEGVRFLDQTKLPLEETYFLARTYQDVAHAVSTMIVRGAPALGVTAAMGVALGVLHAPAATVDELRPHFDEIARTIASTRPTAVNLFWGIARMRALFEAMSTEPVGEIKQALVREAQAMHTEDVEACKQMGAHGAPLLPREGGVLTHCNAGALATCGYGSALGVVRSAVAEGAQIRVYADETRPFLQGARLTAWELMHDGIPTTVLCDNMAATLMRQGKIQAVIVGADRIAANGDVANKIGTYGVAILAKEHGIPFFVAAPWATVDTATPDGEHIEIEQRASREVTHHGGRQQTPHNVEIENPAFDVTPARYVTAIITERGVLHRPTREVIAAVEAEYAATAEAVPQLV